MIPIQEHVGIMERWLKTLEGRIEALEAKAENIIKDLEGLKPIPAPPAAPAPVQNHPTS